MTGYVIQGGTLARSASRTRSAVSSDSTDPLTAGQVGAPCSTSKSHLHSSIYFSGLAGKVAMQLVHLSLILLSAWAPLATALAHANSSTFSIISEPYVKVGDPVVYSWCESGPCTVGEVFRLTVDPFVPAQLDQIRRTRSR